MATEETGKDLRQQVIDYVNGIEFVSKVYGFAMGGRSVYVYVSDDNVVLALRHKLSVTESEAGRHWILALSMGHIPNKAIDRAWGAARRTYNKAKEAGKLPGPQNAYYRFMGDKALYAQDEEHKHLSDLMPWEEGGMQDASEPLESAIEAIPFGFFSDEK